MPLDLPSSKTPFPALRGENVKVTLPIGFNNSILAVMAGQTMPGYQSPGNAFLLFACAAVIANNCQFCQPIAVPPNQAHSPPAEIERATYNLKSQSQNRLHGIDEVTGRPVPWSGMLEGEGMRQGRNVLIWLLASNQACYR
jgi:hypothetical protein